MPIVQADRLTRIGAALLRAAGASEEEADAVAVGCVNANLAGHDSHGIIAIPTYIDRIKAGHIVPGAKWTIVQESPTTTVIDGHWGFGFHVNAKAMALTIEKAKTANVAACTVFRQSHVGRLAAYPLMAMREGMIGLATADSGRSPKHRRAVRRPRGAARHQPDLDRGAVRSRRAVLSGHGDLGGRGRQDRARRSRAAKQIPTGWIIDSEGRHTTDPTQYRKGGALLPLGGTEGYKGSGLAAMVEMLCGLLTGLGFGVEPTGRHNDGCFMAVFKVAAFRPLKDFKKEVAEFARYLKSTPPSEGSPGVFYPGEVEHIREQERRRDGIEIEDATWDKLRALAGEYKLAAELDLDVKPRSGATQGEQHDTANGDGRLPAGAELHQPAELLAASGIARRFDVGRLLPGDRPHPRSRQIPHGVLRRPPGDAGPLRQRPRPHRRIRHPLREDGPDRGADHDGHGHRRSSASPRPARPPISSRSTSRAASPPST